MGTIQFIKKIAVLGTGWGLYSIWSWLYDNPLWLAVISWLGIVQGSIILTIGAVMNNFIFLIMYQKNESDWLGVNGYNEIKEHGDKWAQRVHDHQNILVRSIFWIPALMFRALVWAVRKNNVLAFIVLSIFEDSFITTVFVRGKVGGKLTKKDYWVFLASTILGCTYWSIRNGVILALLKGGLEAVKHFAS